MVQNTVILFSILGVLLLSSFAVSGVYAHAPSGVALTATNSTVKIAWAYHQADVDIIRSVGQNGGGVSYPSTSVLVGNSTAHVIYNNATGHGLNKDTIAAWIDHSLPEGTEFGYKVCHAEPDTASCSDAHTDGTNEGNSDWEYITTHASAVSTVNVSADQNSAVLSWVGWAGNGTSGITSANNTAVAGYRVSYSSDGGSTYTTSISNTSSVTRSHEVTGLESNTQYIFKIAGVTEGSGSVDGNAGINSTWTGTTRGEEPDKVSPPPQASSYSTGSITDGNLQVTVKENKGWDRTLNVALYTNIREDQTKQDSDTYIIWNYFDPVHVSDPHGYFNEVNVVTAQSGVRTMDVTYEITWNKSLARNDAILETTNFPGEVGTSIIKDAWKSFPVKQISYEAPDETPKETIMTLFDGGIMNHLLLINNIEHTLLSAVDYFVYDEIIDVSQDVVVLQQEVGVVQLFEKMTLSQDNMKVGQKYLKTLVISGTVNDEFHQTGEPITFYISSPDGTDSQITAVTTSDRTFKVPIIIDEFESGIYQFQPSHKDILGEPFSYKH